ncbi:MAG: putative flap endonuclease-1-like 5' DNA nuclease [Cocleimonas sp.]|jgi:predicted flap endonuclease-1-like 5' DNA nuclease
MGVFVLGVLCGWLAEWLYFTFWGKAGDDDCSSIKAELELKNKQISSLQSQLASSSENTTNKAKTAAKAYSSKSSTSNKADKSKKLDKSATKNNTSKSKTKPSTNSSAKSALTSKPIKGNKGDDFTKLSGIGPSMSATLKSLGIDTFEKLTSTDDDKLRDMLEQSGARMNNNKDAMDSWKEQATVAAKGDFKALKDMQANLKK